MMPVMCPRCDHPAAGDAASGGGCARCGARLDAMPEIDISQLASLDDHGVDVAGRPPPAPAPASFAPPPQAFAPPAPLAQPAQAFARPPQAFPPSPQAVAQSAQSFAP